MRSVFIARSVRIFRLLTGTKKMIAWKPFTHDGRIYDLAHLHPRRTTIVQEGQPGKPTRTYALQVISACTVLREESGRARRQIRRCFTATRARRAFSTSPGMNYRNFSPRSSKNCRCASATTPGKATSLSLNWSIKTARAAKYEIFFTASRSTMRGILNLFVQSAYVRHRASGETRATQADPHRDTAV